MKLGFVPVDDDPEAASKTMEYAANDYELALMAKGLGRQEEYTKYLHRSGNWQNLWDANYSQDGIQAGTDAGGVRAAVGRRAGSELL